MRTSRKIAAKNKGPANRMDDVLFFMLLYTGIVEGAAVAGFTACAVFVTAIALISNIVAVTVAADAVAVDGEVIVAEVNAVAIVGEESICSTDSVQELEDTHVSPQEQDAILKPGSQHCDYHVIGPLDISHRVEEIHLSF